MDKLEAEEDEGFVDMANELLSKSGIKAKVSSLSECGADYFIKIYEGLIGDDLHGLIKNPVLVSDQIDNCQHVIDAIANDVLRVDLSHISAKGIVKGARIDIRNLLEIFTGLLEYFFEFDDEQGESEEVPEEENDSNILTSDHDIMSGVLQEEFGQAYRDVYPSSNTQSQRSSLMTMSLAGKPPLPPSGVKGKDTANSTALSLSATGRYRSSGHEADTSRVSDSTNELIKLGESTSSKSSSSVDPHHDTADLTQYTLTDEEHRDSYLTAPDKRDSHLSTLTSIESSFQQQISPLDPQRDGGTLDTLGVRPRVELPQENASQSSSEGGNSGRSTPVLHHHYHHHYHHPVTGIASGTASKDPTIPKPSVVGLSEKESSRLYPKPSSLETSKSYKENTALRTNLDRPENTGLPIRTLSATGCSYQSRNIPSFSTSRPHDKHGGQTYSSGLTGLPVSNSIHQDKDIPDRANPDSTNAPVTLPEPGTTTVSGNSGLPSSTVPVSSRQPHCSYLGVPGVSGVPGVRGNLRPGRAGCEIRTFPGTHGVQPVDGLSRTAPAPGSQTKGGIYDSSLRDRLRNYPRPSVTLSDSVFTTLPTTTQRDAQSRDIPLRDAQSREIPSRDASQRYTNADRPLNDSKLTDPPHLAKGAAADLLSRYSADDGDESDRETGDEYDSDVSQHSDTAIDYGRAYRVSRDESSSSTSEESVRRSIHERWKNLNLPKTSSEKAGRRAVTFNEDIQTIPITSRMERLRRLLEDEEDEQRQHNTSAMRDVYHQQLKSLQKEKTKGRDKRKIKGSPLRPKKKAKPQSPKQRQQMARLEAAYRPQGTRGRTTKRTPVRDRKRSASASPVVGRRRMDESEAILPVLYDEFPFLHVSPHTAKEMWKRQSRHLSRLTKTGSDVKKTKSQRLVEEAEARQEKLLRILKKELDHNHRMREQRDREESQRSVKTKINEKRQVAARARRYYDDYQLRMRAKMLKRRTREEQIFKKLFEEGLDIQKHRVRELRQYAREKREALAQRQQNEIDSLENYYRDQFSMLAEEMSRERYEVKVRQQAQEKVVRQMRRELRQKMEKEVQDFQANLTRDEDSAYFRQLEADRLRREFQLAMYKTEFS
ncbi:centrosomal protein of 95 kDa isoform X2 [Nematostella vectensis]|uniref:centrosomal protein of 95 kDa isoform X2 n=1 Tax=Nematostella vectensis TaxID=45351 RepID=UPI0020774D85|nr:centrosomal protein of 95 kDa isoform X2 [Nematostella vectensis]